LKGETRYSIIMAELDLVKLEKELLVKRRLSTRGYLGYTKSKTLERVLVEFDQEI